MHQLRKGSHWPLTFLGGISSLFNLFIPILLSRLLSPDQVGEFKLFFLYLAVVPALSLGVGFTNGAYMWGADKVRGDAKIFVALILAIALGIFATSIILVVGNLLIHNPNQVGAFAFACIPAVVGGLLDAKLVASGKVLKGAIFTSGFEFLRLGVIVCLILLGHSVETIFWAHGFIVWTKLIIVIFVLTRNGSHFVGARREMSGILRYAIPISIAASFDLLLMNADRYVLSGTIMASDFAIYTFGCLAVPPLLILEQSINQVLIPKLASSFVDNKYLVAKNQLFRAIEELMFFLVPSAFLLIFYARPIILLLFTAKYQSAAEFLSWYALYYILLSIPQDVVARARGNSSWILRTSIIFGILATALTATGAWLGGASGALKGFLLAQLLRKLYTIGYLHRSEGWKIREFIPMRSFVSFVVFGAISAFLSSNLSDHLPFSLFLRLMCGGICAVLIYLLSIRAFMPKSWKHLIKPFGRFVI